MNIALGMIRGFRHIHGRDTFRTIHVAGLADLQVGILACFEQRRQEGMFAIEPDQQHEVRPVEQWHETRFHRHAVRVFDAGGETADFDVITTDFASKIRQVSEGGHDADFRRLSWHDGQHRQRN